MKHKGYLRAQTDHTITPEGALEHTFSVVIPGLTTEEYVSLLGLAPAGNLVVELTMGGPPMPPPLPEESVPPPPSPEPKPKKKGGL